jgi:fatty acid desaturase
MQRDEWATLRRRLECDTVAWPTLGVLLIDGGLLWLSLHLFARGHWLGAEGLLLLALLHGYLIHHEAVHGAVFRRSRANAALGRALGWLLLYPFGPRRKSHLAHHRWTGHPVGDPTNHRAIARLRAMSPAQRRRLEAMWRCGIPVLVLGETLSLWSQSIGALSVRRRGALLALAAVCCGVLAWSGAWRGLALWYAPAWYALLCMEEMINLPHHSGAPLIAGARPCEFWRQHEVTHSCRSLPLWSSCVLLNFNLHTAHHYFPSLPWYRLPRAQRLIRGVDPGIGDETENEVAWSWRWRRQPFRRLFAAYLDAQAAKETP